MNGPPTLTFDHITGTTPVGRNLLSRGQGATFRVWASYAQEVGVLWDFTKSAEKKVKRVSCTLFF